MNSIPCNMKTRSLFWTVKSYLIYTYGKEPTIYELKNLAEEIHAKSNIPITREIKRSKELIICWLCDNWAIAQNHLRKIPKEFLVDPNKVIILSKCSAEKKKKLMNEYLLRDKMIEVENFLKNAFGCTKLKMNELREISENICQKTNLKLNRNEKRDKGSNLAWFANNWDIIKPLLPEKRIIELPQKENGNELKKDDLYDLNDILITSNKSSDNQFEEDFFQELMMT